VDKDEYGGLVESEENQSQCPRRPPKISRGLTWPLKMKINLSFSERFSSYRAVNRVFMGYKNNRLALSLEIIAVHTL